MTKPTTKNRPLMVAMLAILPLVVCSCFTYTVIQDPKEASPNDDIRLTTKGDQAFVLFSWKIDSSGAVIGVVPHQIAGYREKTFPRDTIKIIELRQFDSSGTILGTIIILGGLLALAVLAFAFGEFGAG